MFPDRLPIQIAGFLGLVVLTVEPADLVDRLGDARAAGVFFLEYSEMVEKPVLFLQELEGLCGLENPLLIKPRLLTGNSLE